MGRTAVLVGAYLIYSGVAQDDKEAIKITKANRPKCFEKSYNVKFMKEFYHYLKNLRMIFPASILHHSSPPKDSKPPQIENHISLKQIMKKQNLLLHGEERRFIKFIPKVLHYVIIRLKELEE